MTNEKRGGLKVVIFDRSSIKLFSMWFSNKSMQAPSCEGPKTTQRSLFFSFAINNCFPAVFELILKVWWQDATLFVYFDFITFIHSLNHNTFIRRHSLKLLSISSSLVCSVGKTSLWCRAENRTRACLTASRRAANWATPHHKFWGIFLRL